MPQAWRGPTGRLNRRAFIEKCECGLSRLCGNERRQSILFKDRTDTYKYMKNAMVSVAGKSVSEHAHVIKEVSFRRRHRFRSHAEIDKQFHDGRTDVQSEWGRYAGGGGGGVTGVERQVSGGG